MGYGAMERDGSLQRCPVCRTTLPTPQRAYGESHCHRCEARLWHLALPSGTIFFVQRAGENIYDLMAGLGNAGATGEDLEAILKDADSLDVAELLMDLEEALHS
jgi:hypothetical protein